MLPRIQHSNKYLYALAATGILYAFLHEPALLDDTYYAFMTRVSGVPHEVLSWTFMHYDKPGALVHGKPCVQTHPTLPLQNLDINSALRFREREPGCLNEQSVEALRSVAYAACPQPSSHNTLLTSPPPTSHDVRELRPYSRLFPHPKWMHAGLVGQAQDPLAFRECSILYHPEGGCLESHVRQIPSIVKRCVSTAPSPSSLCFLDRMFCCCLSQSKACVYVFGHVDGREFEAFPLLYEHWPML